MALTRKEVTDKLSSLSTLRRSVDEAKNTLKKVRSAAPKTNNYARLDAAQVNGVNLDIYVRARVDRLIAEMLPELMHQAIDSMERDVDRMAREVRDALKEELAEIECHLP